MGGCQTSSRLSNLHGKTTGQLVVFEHGAQIGADAEQHSPLGTDREPGVERQTREKKNWVIKKKRSLGSFAIKRNANTHGDNGSVRGKRARLT